ncbi:MAG: hypothetical protein RL148_2962 [Planctomycetota bacterium]
MTSERGPDGSFYGAGAFAAQCERLFPRAWLVAPEQAESLAPQHVLPATLLPGALDEPIVFARDAAGALHCMSNVCTHRGKVLCDEAGRATALRCTYHGRSFAMDGRCQHGPGFEAVPGFPTPADHLARIGTGTLGTLRFVNLLGGVPFAEWVEPVLRHASHLVAALPTTATHTHAYEFDANWALYVDNYLEGLHVPFLHGGLTDTIDVRDYRYEMHPHGTLQVGIARPGEPALDLPAGHALAGQRVAALWFWLFPGTMLNFYPWGLSVNSVEPLGPSRTRVRYLAFVARPGLRTSGAGGDLDRVEREDQAAVLSVQRGVRSRLYRGGAYAPVHEAGTRWFHERVQAALGRGPEGRAPDGQAR